MEEEVINTSVSGNKNQHKKDEILLEEITLLKQRDIKVSHELERKEEELKEKLKMMETRIQNLESTIAEFD